MLKNQTGLILPLFRNNWQQKREGDFPSLTVHDCSRRLKIARQNGCQAQFSET
jgi:hypothetical protein